MKRLSVWVVSPLLLALVAPAFADDEKKPGEKKPEVNKPDEKKPDEKKPEQKKPEEKKPGAEKPDEKKPGETKPDLPKPPDPKEEERKLIRTGVLSGELVSVESGKQAFRVKVPYPVKEFSKSEYQAMLRARASYQRAALRRDRNGMLSAQRSMLQHQAKLYSTKTKYAELTIEPAEEFEVRLPVPKATFDDMGNVKQYTRKELAELRGRDRLFDGEFSDLAPRQLVQVTLVKSRDELRPKKRDEAEALLPQTLQASRVVILRQPLPRQ